MSVHPAAVLVLQPAELVLQPGLSSSLVEVASQNLRMLKVQPMLWVLVRRASNLDGGRRHPRSRGHTGNFKRHAAHALGDREQLVPCARGER